MRAGSFRIRSTFKFVPRFFSISIASDVENEDIETKEKNKENLKEKRNEYMRAYQLKNKERLKEKKKAYMREYQLKNKENLKNYKSEYNLKNKEDLKEYKREYGVKYKKKRKENYFKNQKKKNINFELRKIIYSWNDKNSVQSFFDYSAKLLSISELSGWYRISTKQIENLGGSALFKKFGSLGLALKFVFPEYPWDLSKFSLRGKKSAQRWLLVKMKLLLPNDIIIEDHLHPLLLWDSNRHVELDIWIEKYNLALEYQGEQHYNDFPESGFADLAEIKKRDEEKKRKCAENGITLICIPYWWDKRIDSLSSTLNQYLPNVFPLTDSPPIPTSLPSDFKKTIKSPFKFFKPIMEGYDYNNENPEGWYMSEKLDGIRAYWDGEQFWSKRGNVINVPESLKEGLPNYHLDGELWGGYENSDLMNVLLKFNCGKGKRNIDWTKYKFCVFDAPQQEATYDKRHDFLQNNIIQYCNSNFSLTPIQKCLGRDHLENKLNEIIGKGGEGIMIYHPDSHYESGRTKNVLKVKKYFDNFVKFMSVNPQSYTLVCEQENGQTCFVKCVRGYYLDPPGIGDKILVRHQGFFAKSEKYKYPVLIELTSMKNDE